MVTPRSTIRLAIRLVRILSFNGLLGSQVLVLAIKARLGIVFVEQIAGLYG